MPRKPKGDTTTTSIRMDSELRIMLEAIAERELRTLTNQMTLFLREACEEYMDYHSINFDPHNGVLVDAEDYDEIIKHHESAAEFAREEELLSRDMDSDADVPF